MTVHDAYPGDIYKDGDGRIWKVLYICEEKTVGVREMIDHATLTEPPIRSGGVSGLMWHGFVKLEPKK